MVLDDAHGNPLQLGRMSRVPSRAMVRQLRHRDRTCRFPGCERQRFTNAHHVAWWSRGGRTDLDNLVLLCGFHHRLVHEGGWSMILGATGVVRWFRPNGVRYRAGPSALSYTSATVLSRTLTIRGGVLHAGAIDAAGRATTSHLSPRADRCGSLRDARGSPRARERPLSDPRPLRGTEVRDHSRSESESTIGGVIPRRSPTRTRGSECPIRRCTGCSSSTIGRRSCVRPCLHVVTSSNRTASCVHSPPPSGPSLQTMNTVRRSPAPGRLPSATTCVRGSEPRGVGSTFLDTSPPRSKDSSVRSRSTRAGHGGTLQRAIRFLQRTENPSN